MLCQKCKVNEAQFQFTKTEDGQVVKLSLCAECAAALKLPLADKAVDLSGMMAELKNQLDQLQDTLAADSRAASHPACPLCGMKRAEILKKGRLGCDRCYEVFGAEMVPVVVSLQRGDQHVGKVPQRISAGLRRSVETGRIRRELDKAIAAEQYEVAAQLRDQLRALSVGMEPS